MAEQRLEYGILNVVAHPHGPAVYRHLLEVAANQEVNFWGDFNAAIRAPTEVERGILQGAIVIGTQIDLTEPLIDRTSLQEIPASEDDARLSASHLYNGRVFYYTFVEDRHLLFFESYNEFGKRLSPGRAQKIFSLLMSPEILGLDAPLVDVTVVPEEDTLERLLGIKRLDKVEIFLKRPNPADVNDEEVANVLSELQDQGAKSQDISLARAAGSPGIVLNARNYIWAKVAQFNGHVATSGQQEDGEAFAGSTKQYPKIIRVLIDAATSSRRTAINVARATAIDDQGENSD